MKKAHSTPLTLKEASQFLGSHPNTLRQWDRNGFLKAIRFGPRKDRRYRKEDLQAFLERSGYVKDQQEAKQVSEVRRGYVEDYATLLVQWGKITDQSTIIDVPCGTGAMSRALAEKGLGASFTLLDINAEMIKAAQENTAHLPQQFTYAIGDAAEINTLVHEQVDAIFCLNGLHIYIDQKEKFLRGCFQQLKPGGVLIFDVSTRGIGDKLSKDFLHAQSTAFQRTTTALGKINNFPAWPDESLMDHYRLMAKACGFSVNQTLSIDTWKPIDAVIHETLHIPGRLRKWFPDLSEEQRTRLYEDASQMAKQATGITTIKHNRVFFIATKNNYMKAPEQPSEYQKFHLDLHDIRAIAHRLHLGDIPFTSRFELGMINDVFALGEDYVLKVNSVDRDTPKLAKEAAIYRALPQHHIPAPRSMRLKNNPDYMVFPISSWSDARAMHLENWAKLTPSQQHHLMQEIGRLLGRIHNIRQSEVALDGNTTSDRFSVKENIALRIGKIAEELRASKVLDPQVIEKIERFYTTHSAFDLTVPPSLLHGNFVFGNIITDEDRVTGIIDWEWATFGHSEEELANILYRGPGPSSVMGVMSEELIEAFKKGYTDTRPVDSDFQKRYLAYALLYFLKVLPKVPQWTHKPEKQREYIDAVAVLMKQLALS